MRIKRRIAFCFMSGLYAFSANAAMPAAGGSVTDPGPQAVMQADEYKLDAGDKVRITVFNEPTLSGEFAVSSDGQLSLPLIGAMPAIGRTPAEVAHEAQVALANGYLRNPQVSAEVTAYRPYYILGEVKSPGQYPFANGLTIAKAVATAQGYTPRAERKWVYVRHAGSSTEERHRVPPDLPVRPGDTIRLGERYF